jgi:hypothetical protein
VLKLGPGAPVKVAEKPPEKSPAEKQAKK